MEYSSNEEYYEEEYYEEYLDQHDDDERKLPLDSNNLDLDNTNDVNIVQQDDEASELHSNSNDNLANERNVILVDLRHGQNVEDRLTEISDKIDIFVTQQAETITILKELVNVVKEALCQIKYCLKMFLYKSISLCV